MKKIQYIGGGKPTGELILQSGTFNFNFQTSTSDGITHDASDVLFGDEHQLRDIVAVIFIKGINSDDFPTLTGVWIGPDASSLVSATIVQSKLFRTGDNFLWGIIATARVPAGTTGAVRWQVSSFLNESLTSDQCFIFRCQNLRSNAGADSGQQQNGSPLTVTLNALNRSVIIGGCMTRTNSGEFPIFTWSGVTAPFTSSMGTFGSNACSVGLDVLTTANPSLDVSCSMNITHERILIAAAFR